jgi:ppGpp synthetase/RelA/SpoT-type nucleotidyltranferase
MVKKAKKKVTSLTKVPSLTKEECASWYDENLSAYKKLTDAVRGTLETLIKGANINYLSVTGRTKDKDSLCDKAVQKNYQNLEEELHDFCGLRVVTYLELDADKVCKLINKHFDVDTDNSTDKTSELGSDKIGYRSNHLVCTLSEDRVKLPEFAPFKGLFFEIQVCTVLQHAWAEIEHDRQYKNPGTLADHIQRDLNLVAGQLEIADKMFSEIAGATDAYEKDVSKKTKAGDLDIEINSTSLMQYLEEKVESLTEINILLKLKDESNDRLVMITEEVKKFGIKTLKDLDALFSTKSIQALKKNKSYRTSISVLRYAMMFNDLDKYFRNSWSFNWNILTSDGYKLLREKYSEVTLNNAIQNYGLIIE